jgi:hypothetical protein
MKLLTNLKKLGLATVMLGIMGSFSVSDKGISVDSAEAGSNVLFKILCQHKKTGKVKEFKASGTMFSSTTGNGGNDGKVSKTKNYCKKGKKIIDANGDVVMGSDDKPLKIKDDLKGDHAINTSIGNTKDYNNKKRAAKTECKKRLKKYADKNPDSFCPGGWGKVTTSSKGGSTTLDN